MHLELGCLPLLRPISTHRRRAARIHSSFRDWAGEYTEALRDVCALVLAHVSNDCVEAAYRGSDLFEHRRTLMQ